MLLEYRRFSKVADLLQETTEVRLNGERVWVATAVSSEPVTAVLERFDTHCSAHPGALGDMWKGLAKAEAPQPARGAMANIHFSSIDAS